MAIVRVHGNDRGRWTSGISFTVTMGETPIEGNVIVLCIAIRDYVATVNVSSVVQTNVTWTKQTANDDDYRTSEIWYGVVGGSPGDVITVNMDETPNGAVGNACEYSGLETTGFLDRTAVNEGWSIATDSGTTAETTQDDELWVASICAVSDGQTNPTNGFTLLDGTGDGTLSAAYLEKIVSSIGTANTGTTNVESVYWVGVIATFEAAPPSESVPVVHTHLVIG